MQTAQWLTRLGDPLPPNPCTYACFLQGTPGWVTSYVLIDIQASLPRQHFVTHLQCLPKATNDNDTQKVPEPQTMGAGEHTLGSYSCIPALSMTLPSKLAAGTVWDEILCWADLWSGLSQPFSSPKALVTVWYIPCSLIHCDKDCSNTSNFKAVIF